MICFENLIFCFWDCQRFWEIPQNLRENTLDAFRTKFITDLQNSTLHASNQLQSMCLIIFWCKILPDGFHIRVQHEKAALGLSEFVI